MYKVIITGATGIVGVALTEYLVQQGIKVLAVVRPNSEKISRLPASNGNLEIIECELAKISHLPVLVGDRFDSFYHLGWTAAGRFHRHNASAQNRDIEYTLQAVMAAKNMGCETFIGAGSQAEYGRLNHTMSPSMSVNPDTAYGVAKYAAGKLSSLLCSDIGMRHIWARIFSVYGNHDNRNSMITYAIERLLHGDKPSFTPCEQYWDYLYCSDTARALYLLGIKGKNQKIYNIGSGNARPLNEFIQILRDTIDPSLLLGIGERKYAKKQVMYLCADIESLTQDTGFKPEITFEEGIRKTIAWYKEEFLKNHQ